MPASARPATNSQSLIRCPGSRPALGSSSSRTAGLSEQADRDVDPLLVAAGEGRDLIVAAIGEAGLIEHRLHDRLGVVGALESGEEPQVLGDGQPAVERRLLRDPADLAVGDRDSAGVGRVDPGEDRQQGRLAGAVGADHRQQLALGGLEAHLAKGEALAVALGEVLHLEHGLA